VRLELNINIRETENAGIIRHKLNETDYRICIKLTINMWEFFFAALQVLKIIGAVTRLASIFKRIRFSLPL